MARRDVPDPGDRGAPSGRGLPAAVRARPARLGRDAQLVGQLLDDIADAGQPRFLCEGDQRGSGERNGADGDGAAQIHEAFEGAALTNAPNNAGVLVEGVADGSPAQQAGLRENDIILAIGRVRVANVDQLRQAVNGAQAFALTIRRGNSTLVFTIQ